MRQPAATFRVISFAACSIVLVACTTIHERDKFKSESGTVRTLSIDAKQRVVLFTKRPDVMETTTESTNGGVTQTTVRKNDSGYTVTCAEPSPDALSALSTSVGGGIQDPKAAVNFATAVSESAGSIGLRTQSIQLLRDGMYRLCEGYAAGAVSGEEFNRQQRRYQNLMLSLLAIEQLTGAVVARQVALGDGSAGASVGENADQAAADVTTADKAVDDAQKALTAAQTTLANDEKTCKAAAPDTTNAACGKASDDAQAVTDKDSALSTAKKKDDTAKLALQAARSSVSASAAGAHVSFSDAPQTNKITDGTARYVAEATRTIVSTTLIASFAQEECTRLWDFVASDSAPDKLAAFSANLRAMSAQTDQAKADVGVGINQMLTNCSDAQKSLLSKASLFTPNYGAPVPPILLVIGADSPIPLALGGPTVDLRIVGGTPPYDAVVTPALKPELTATLPAPKGAEHTVHLERPTGAAKTSGNATVTIVDSANAHVDIPILFAGKPKTPETPPPATTVSPPTKVAATSAGSKIIVSFTPPNSGSIKEYLATAISTDTAKPTLTKAGPKTVKSIEIPSCVPTQAYKVTVHTVPTSGANSAESSPAADVTCTNAAAPAASPISSPTGVEVKSAAGQILIVTFAPLKDDGGGALQYTATPMDAATGKPGKAVSGASPITLTGCKVGASYGAQVVASRGASKSDPGKSSGSVVCQK